MTTATATATEPAALVMSYLEETLGLSFSGPRRTRLLAAIEAQRAASKLSPEGFLTAVSGPGSAFDRLVAQVTVGETYFFRDRNQCELLRELVLPQLAAPAAGEQSFAIWSAGCASGEETFTLAALAAEAGLGDRYVVVGSDAAQGAVDRARRGRYGRWSMRSTTKEELAAHFREEDGYFYIAERLRARTRFVQRNLLDGPPPPGRFDVVLCRNLLIYLTRDAVQRVAEVLTGALSRDGWLLTAAGDPPLAAPGLEPVRTPYGLAYRRVQPGAPAGALSAPGARAALATRTAGSPGRRPARPTPVAPGPPARPAAPARKSAAAPAGARKPAAAPAGAGKSAAGKSAAAPAGAGQASALAASVRALGDAGRLEEACRAADAAVQAHPLDAELRYLAGVVLLEAGRLEEAAAAAASAVYLGPELAAGHLLLGQAEHARGNRERARRSFRNASRLLAAAPSQQPVEHAGDVPAGHLADVASRYLAARGHGR